MPLPLVTHDQVVDCLRAVGLQAGDGLLVHSAVQFLGRPEGGIGMYLQALWEVIGSKGTIAVPTFNFAFAHGAAYDPQHTPSQGMGSFSEYVRCAPGALRSTHPMQSLAVLGRWADDLAGRDTPTAFEPGSAFARMFELDFRLLLLGADVRAVSVTHISEQRYQVPYRYWKDFTGPVHTLCGVEQRTYRMFVRRLDLDPQLHADHVQVLLEQRGQWQAVPLHYGRVSACKVVDYVAAVDEMIAADPWALVLNPPREAQPGDGQ